MGSCRPPTLSKTIPPELDNHTGMYKDATTANLWSRDYARHRGVGQMQRRRNPRWRCWTHSRGTWLRRQVCNRNRRPGRDWQAGTYASVDSLDIRSHLRHTREISRGKEEASSAVLPNGGWYTPAYAGWYPPPT
eukprot:scaffold4342_cov234-Pinguiococcus_pyrenoidosus.AAC.3